MKRLAEILLKAVQRARAGYGIQVILVKCSVQVILVKCSVQVILVKCSIQVILVKCSVQVILVKSKNLTNQTKLI